MRVKPAGQDAAASPKLLYLWIMEDRGSDTRSEDLISMAIIDYEMGSRRSVQKALLRVGADARITGDPDEILGADGVIIPGVGSFPEAMRRLRSAGLDQVLYERHRAKRPILGICLGMQMFFEYSEEQGGAEGLNFLDGKIRRLPSLDKSMKLPHVGWNRIQWRPRSRLLAGIAEELMVFYQGLFYSILWLG